MLVHKEDKMDTYENQLVSAVITTHNRKDLLKRAIDSVLAQTYPNMELIVVSDASTDGTDEMCSRRNDLKYISIPKAESRGGNYARNLGINAAKGEYVAFLDDDDTWFPTKIEKQVKLIEEKKCECVYCLRLMQRINNGTVQGQTLEGLTYKCEGDLSKKIFRHSFTSTSCLLVTNKILKRVGGFDENLNKLQEYELLIRISQMSSIYYCHKEPLVFYNIDDSDGSRISNDPMRLPIAKDYIESKHHYLLRKSGLLNRFLHEDWMLTALYGNARECQFNWQTAQLALYYYITLPFRKLLIKLFS